jgi:hypothetical protein
MAIYIYIYIYILIKSYLFLFFMRLFGGVVDSMEAQPRFILRKWASVADGKQCYEEQKLGEDKLPGKSGSLQLRHRGDSQLSGIMLFPCTWKWL